MSPGAQYEPGQELPGTVYRVIRHLATGGIVHFSIQEDHLHFTVEAKAATAEQIAKHSRLASERAKRGLETKDRDMLRRGIAGLAISFARRLNRLLGRRGKVWADRHHRRELKTPTEVRNALVYVFQNYIHHGARVYGVGLTDRFSTGPSFDGWAEPHVTDEEHGDTEPWRPGARTWLLGHGWRRAGGLISTLQAPPRRVGPSTYAPGGNLRDFVDHFRAPTRVQ